MESFTADFLFIFSPDLDLDLDLDLKLDPDLDRNKFADSGIEILSGGEEAF